MAEKKLPFEVEITAVDKISAPLDRLSDKLEKLQSPAKKFGAAFSRLGEASGIGRVTDAVKGVGDAAGQVLGRFAAVGAGALAAAGGIFAMVKASADVGDRIDELATKAGMGVEAFQELAYSASFSGIEQEALASGLTKMNRNITQAIMGNKQMTEWFGRAGLTVKDLKKMKPEEVFAKIADKIQDIPADSPKRAALAMALLGKSGADMIPMLTDGSEALREQAEEARRLGVIMGEDAIKASVAFNDQFDKTMKAIQGVGRMIAGVLMPVIQPMLQSLQEWVVNNRALIQSRVVEWAQQFAAALPSILTNLQNLATGILSFIDSVSAFVEMIGGWKVALAGLAALMAGPLVSAIVSLGIALAATPVGWIIGGLAAITAAGWLLYTNWDKIWNFISMKVGDVYEEIAGWIDSLVGIVPDWMKRLFGGDTTVTANAAPTAVAGSLTPQAGQNGQASVTVDFKNLPPGATVKPDQNNGVPLNLGMGYAMPGAF